MSRPLLVDLFCGGGGAAMGYWRAGFDIIGVDIERQPHYPFPFVQGDALAPPLDLARADAIHASPPCHDHSTVTGRNRKANGPHGTGWMLNATLSMVAATGLPFAVENVEGARWPASVYRIRLCGSSFGLDVRRHRWFATNVAVMAPPCAHTLQQPRFRSLDSRRKTLAAVVGVHGHLNYAGEAELRNRAMGIDWMPQDRLAQSIPPAYTEHIGRSLLAGLA